MTAIQQGTGRAASMEAAPKVLTAQGSLAESPITREIKRLGATDEHLEVVRWSGARKGLPFDLWSIRGHTGTPVAAIGWLKAYCTFKWLILDDPPASREKDDAWLYISTILAAPIFKFGLRHRRAQQLRARRPRIKAEDGSTIGEIIGRLAIAPEYRDLTAKELWPHFFSALDARGLGPKEIEAPKDRMGTAYTYQAQAGRNQITSGRFATIVSQFRRHKSR